MAKTIEDLFFYLVSFFDLLVILLLIIFNKKIKGNTIFGLILGYCLLNSSCNIIPKYLLPTDFYYPILVFFTATEYLIFAYLFSLLLKNKKFQKAILILSILFLFVVILNYNSGKSQAIDSLPIGIETILILIYSFYFLYEQMNIVDDSFIYNRFQFWIVIGLMVYLGGSFFIYIFANTVDDKILDSYWFLTYVFYIIKNIFFIIAMVLHLKETKLKRTQIHRLQPYLN
jgi:hypothetical protein